ncbi:PDZ domain-containing protein [Photobacterium damselae]|uniref:PDZ domain-containing protein n=1 Tax=Photobacterium damselae subsp. damselae TaxID=85581 RepID=A0A850QP71_PHODD|nr:hypothetical protein [Photobacterium damselae subsp. damselae]
MEFHVFIVKLDSIASRAGLLRGDIILSIDGETFLDVNSCQTYINHGSKIEIEVKRDNKIINFFLTKKEPTDNFGLIVSSNLQYLGESKSSGFVTKGISVLVVIAMGLYIHSKLDHSSSNQPDVVSSSDPYIPNGQLFCLSKSAFNDQIDLLSRGVRQYADQCFSSGADIPIRVEETSHTGANKVTLLTNGKTWFVPFEAIHYGYKKEALFSKDASILTKFSLSNNQKSTLCKAYIGSIFGHSPRIIEHYDTDKDGLVYVRYVRKSDSTLWSYRCDFSNDNRQIIWSAFLLPDQQWGRWRDEDTTALDYNTSGKLAMFEVPQSGGRVVEVKL